MMDLDKFYTPKEVALTCINLVPNIEQYDKIIEPSAGNGSFSLQLECDAYDIAPENEHIIKQDWLNFYPPIGEHTLVIGNPPFGPRASLAKQFIKHSQEIGAETIAFILPDTFSKITNQSFNLFPDNWKLIVEYKLNDCNFIINDKENYYVPCSFYVWTKQESTINLRKTKLPLSDDFSFLPRGDIRADFSINGNNGKVKEIKDITNPKAEHYIQARKKPKQDLIKIFSNLQYNILSSVNGGNYWIGQQEILKAYYDFLEEEKNE